MDEKKKKVYINASQVANLIGLNPYGDASEEFEKLWARYDPLSYAKHNPKSNLFVIDKCYRFLEAEEINSRDCENKPERKDIITEEEFNKHMSDFKIKEKVEEKKKSIPRIVDGILNEDSDLDKFAQAQKIEIKERNSKMYYWSNDRLTIGGKVDGLSESENGDLIVIENKHRKSRLFNELRSYERIQLVMYMKLTGAKEAILIENYKNKTAMQKIEWFEEEWEGYLELLEEVVEELMEKCK